MENINLDLPLEFRKSINDILLDSPSIEQLGDKQFKVKKLRPYALHRIYDVGIRLMEKAEDVKDAQGLMFAMATDLSACAEIVAIVLCNHLFDADDVKDYDSAMDLMSRNDKLIEMMKVKVMLSSSDINQWSAIIINAFNSLQVSEVFQLRTSVKLFTDSATMIRKKVAEQSLLWQQARSGT